MQAYAQVRAEAPLSFGDSSGIVYSELARYVPGSSLLGGLASAHQLMRADPAEFAAFFLQGRVHCGNCYPAKFQARELTDNERMVQPLPLTARSCKRFGGFKFNAGNENERRAGVTDLLIPLALFALSGEERADLLDIARDHPETGYPLDRISGFFRRGDTPAAIGKAGVATGLRTRNGINYRTGTVQSSILYSRQTLAEGSPFWGRWFIDDDLWDSFQEFVDEVIEADLLRVGNNRTRGFGQVRLGLRPLQTGSAAELGERVVAFTQLFRRAASAARLAIPAGVYVPITLASDALLQDTLMRARLRLEEADLAAYGMPGARLIFHAAGTNRIRGWHGLWGTPKADEWAIALGSVFLFVLPQADDAAWASLLRLQCDGLGLRRAEGFGAVSVADLFHLDCAWEVYR